MEGNFYKNPLVIIWKAKNNLMPLYLVVIALIFLVGTIVGAFYIDIIDFSSFQIEEYFSVSSTGLTLTLALFVAGKSAFNKEELKVLAQYENKEFKKGQALIDFIGPYVFTSALFLATGLVSVFGPFIKVNLDPIILVLMKIFYINLLSLGLLSLFNLVITMLNDVYSAANRN
ncbi:hypothetical protein [Sporosarcina sp. P7]|uniref:hypothetical protein n=1 Tax=Sporosarcina sp. P7 TaxID=2048244 RepID=UPI000C16FDEA|nr:hypothetical protein [Sporosarcina sp. P7]PID24095.1 hypothetical protein CSV60_11825 [Sporosarcina sp. P7]